MATKQKTNGKPRGGARRRSRAARPGGGRTLLLLLAGLALFAGGLYLGGRALRRYEAAPSASPLRRAERAPHRAPRATGTQESANPRPIRLALVVDDLGRSLLEVQEIAALGVPVTYAVLPYETLTPRVVEDLRQRKVEILCHLPMEPEGKENPGFGALRHGMSAAELATLTNRALDAVPGAVGVNNHMGSELSADEPAMRAVLGVLAERGLYYLDSRTSPESVGYKAAIALGVPAAERQVFLDPAPGVEAVRAEFHRLLELARQHGSAIAIGHPHPATFEVLRQEIPKARAAGFEFVPASYLLDRPGAGPE